MWLILIENQIFKTLKQLNAGAAAMMITKDYIKKTIKSSSPAVPQEPWLAWLNN